MTPLFPSAARYYSTINLTLRPYQTEAVESAFKQWSEGTRGVLWRMSTGSGKTPTACAAFDRWLSLDQNNRCMIVSYETELVWQFAQEVQDFLNATPGIEMASESIDPDSVPLIVVASRQTLMQKPLATQEQRDYLAEHWGITSIGLTTASLAKMLIRTLENGLDPSDAEQAIAEHNASVECNHDREAVSRLHKFDWRYNWLVCLDEAHKYAMKLKTVGHMIEWFEQNPNHRRLGLTATPKRFDGVSIGDRLFPGIGIDYPLVSAVGRSALSEGFAVKYVQKYISVEGVDFKSLKQIAGDFDEGELERVLSEEETLAKLVQPLLDLVGDRRTLIFSPGVNMAKMVANFINARSECTCECGKVSWHPNPSIGDGAVCKECNAPLSAEHVTKSGRQADTIWGEVPKLSRKEIYRQHKEGAIQFLSVCGLCKEGYNDPDISCVALFRPVSRKASSLAEQMKGRGCRPLRGLVDGTSTAEERLALISASNKPDCLIVDLVGISGLGDCATTAQIYSDGLDDAIIARAEKYQLEGGIPGTEEAVQQAIEDIAEEREQAKREREERELREREEAERRSKAGADVRYTTHDIGHGHNSETIPGMATEKQIKFIAMLGMRFTNWQPTKKQAGRIITQLKEEGLPVEDVAYLNRLKEMEWERTGPTIAQVRALSRHGINAQGMTPIQASQAFASLKEGKTPTKQKSCLQEILDAIAKASTHGELDAVRGDVVAARHAGRLTDQEYIRIAMVGKQKREEVF